MVKDLEKLIPDGYSKSADFGRIVDGHLEIYKHDEISIVMVYEEDKPIFSILSDRARIVVSGIFGTWSFEGNSINSDYIVGKGYHLSIDDFYILCDNCIDEHHDKMVFDFDTMYKSLVSMLLNDVTDFSDDGLYTGFYSDIKSLYGDCSDAVSSEDLRNFFYDNSGVKYPYEISVLMGMISYLVDEGCETESEYHNALNNYHNITDISDDSIAYSDIWKFGMIRNRSLEMSVLAVIALSERIGGQ